MNAGAAYIALGSNLAEPLEQLRLAAKGLARLGQITGRSSLWRTLPVGGPPGQDDYLNAVVALEPFAGAPEEVLAGLQALEATQGRVRELRWAARTLDLDLLAWGDRVQQRESLSLPHPRMMVRAFVLAPLCELEPSWRHPLTGERACEVLAGLPQAGIERTDLSW